MDRRPFVVACIPAYKEEKNIGRVVLLTRRYVDRVVVCDDGGVGVDDDGGYSLDFGECGKGEGLRGNDI